MTDAAREKEEAVCESFRVKEKPQEWLSQGLTIVRQLRDIERDIDLALTLERIKIPAPAVRSHSSSSSSSSDSDEIELERGKPIVFDGHSENWPEFRASFELTVKKKHTSQEILMYYLRRYLSEQPKKVIAGYMGDEFDEAWDALEEKYWDKKGYIRKLHFQLSNIKKCRENKDLERFQLELNRLVRQLTKQGENVQGDPTYLALERKVPKPILRKIFEKKTSSATWSTNQFCAALKEIVKHENELNAIYANDSDSKKELTNAI